jgi:hypothetical protein
MNRCDGAGYRDVVYGWACVWLGAESGNGVGLSGTPTVEPLTGGWRAGNKEAGAPTAGAEATPRAAYSSSSSGGFTGNT